MSVDKTQNKDSINKYMELMNFIPRSSNDLEYIKDRDPDQTIFIFRPGEYDSTIKPGETEFLITKNRVAKRVLLMPLQI